MGGIKRYRDPSVCLSVCPKAQLPWACAAALGFRHAGCLQLSNVPTTDPSAASQTAIGGGAYRLAAPGAITCFIHSGICIVIIFLVELILQSSSKRSYKK